MVSAFDEFEYMAHYLLPGKGQDTSNQALKEQQPNTIARSAKMQEYSHRGRLCKIHRRRAFGVVAG